MAAPSISEILTQNVIDNAGALKLKAQDLESSGLTWLLDNLIKDTHLNITDAQVTATDDGATVSGTLSLLTVVFTVDVTFEQQKKDVSVSVSGSMATGNTLPLSHLIETYITGTDVIPEIDVSGLTLDAASDQFSMTASFSESWSLPLGASALTVDGLGVTLSYGAEKSATLTGTLHIASVTAAVTYAMPGSFSIDTTIPKVEFGTFVNSFLHSAFSFPNDFPKITLLNAGIALSKSDGDFSLTLSASPSGWGTLEIDVMQQNGVWQAISGFALPSGWQLSKLSSVFSSLNGLSFESLSLVVSTVSDGSFKFSADGAPSLSDGAVEGVTFSAGLALSGGALGHVASLSGASTADVTATIGADMSDTYLEASLGGEIHIPAKSNLVLKDPGLELHAKPFGVSLHGTVDIPVGSDTLEVVGRLTVTESEADFALDAEHLPSALANPMGFHGITLDEIGVELGVGFEPPSVDLGLEGQFHVGTAD